MNEYKLIGFLILKSKILSTTIEREKNCVIFMLFLKFRFDLFLSLSKYITV